MAGKLKGVMPATTPSGCRSGIDVHSCACRFRVFALQQMGNADREFDDLDAALNVALGIGNGLAMF